MLSHASPALRLFSLVLLAATCPAPAVADDLLRGAIDLHCHTAPDALPRSVDDVQLARLARDAGMRAVVLKSHYTATADRAALAMQAVPGIEVFGGVALNRAVGGLNPEAVLRMVQMHGKRGRIVWLPTWDGEHHVHHAAETRPSVPVLSGGRPVPELAAIFQLVAEHDLVLATGHASARESLTLIDAARAAGVRRIVVTHALAPNLGASDDTLAEMSGRGAYIELVWLQHHTPATRAGNTAPPGPEVPLERAVQVIRRVGADHVVIASDFGQAANPPPPEGLRAFIVALRAAGISTREIDLMVRHNPARLLGLGTPTSAATPDR